MNAKPPCDQPATQNCPQTFECVFLQGWVDGRRLSPEPKRPGRRCHASRWSVLPVFHACRLVETVGKQNSCISLSPSLRKSQGFWLVLASEVARACWSFSHDKMFESMTHARKKQEPHQTYRSITASNMIPSNHEDQHRYISLLGARTLLNLFLAILLVTRNY